MTNNGEDMNQEEVEGRMKPKTLQEGGKICPLISSFNHLRTCHLTSCGLWIEQPRNKGYCSFIGIEDSLSKLLRVMKK